MKMQKVFDAPMTYLNLDATNNFLLLVLVYVAPWLHELE